MRFGIIGNINKPAVRHVTENLIGYLVQKRVSFVVHEQLGKWFQENCAAARIENKLIVPESELPRRSSVIVSLGGDGTMLTAARLVGNQGTPILGVNLGKLGFIAEVSVDELEECLDDIIAGRYFLEERTVLKAVAAGDGQVYYALNDVVVDKGSSARVIDLETSVDGDYLTTYTADGLIVSTPTGSTAYSLSSGGPIVVPKSDVIVISPISPHTLSARPVIVPDENIVRIRIHSGVKPVHMIADGQLEKFYETPVEITIQKAPYLIKLVKRKKRNYFDLLRTKLMWGKDLRRES